MASEDLVLDPKVLTALEKAKDLPSVPAVAMEVLRLAREDDADTGELARVVSLDPALAAKILKIANSALFGRAYQIVTLQRACSQLGFKTVKLWALSFAMVDALQRPRVQGFDHQLYWKRCLFRAVSAKLFAEAVAPRLAEEAFLTGMLSRIGHLVLATCLPEEYKAVVAAGGDRWTSTEVQREALGYSSDDLTLALLQSWGLPDLIHQAVLGAHSPDQRGKDLPPESRELAWILTVAGHSEALFGGDHPQSLVNLYESARKYFGLGKDEVEKILSGLDRHTAEIGEVLHIRIGEQLDTGTVIREAQLRMLRETVVVLRDAIVNERRAAQLEFENSLLLLKAQTDPLTGLAHRITFQEALDGSTLRVADGCCPARVGLLMIDIDGFKTVNDSYGHLVGDEVLQMVGRVLRTGTRGDDLAARYGGDEFAVVLLRSSPEGMQGAAERLRIEIANQRIDTDRGPLSITVSIGGAHVAMFEGPVSPHELLTAADQFLYAAKRRGRNRCEFLGPGATPPPLDSPMPQPRGVRSK
jgi:diguanylate cyclase (GGDEF)-like protein